MNLYARATVSGFLATLLLSVLMLLKKLIDFRPELNVIHLLTGWEHVHLGLPAEDAVGWVTQFLIGTVLWGLAFAVTYRFLPGRNPVTKGLSFSVAAWLLMMVVFMPVVGGGLFGRQVGPLAPAITLVLHLIWGVALGSAFLVSGPRID